MIAPRTVLPELLDELPPESPAALNSRQDLRIINRLLGSRAWFVRVLRERARWGERVLEIGAGTGELGRAMSTVVSGVAGLDLNGRPSNWPEAASWFEADVFNFTDWAGYPIVAGNLVFHHFNRDRLTQLGEHLNAHARLLIASEPLRGRRAEKLFSLVCPLIRAHPVTQYDGRVSIAAGFRGHELPRLLHLDPGIWNWCVQETWRGSCRLIAERKA